MATHALLVACCVCLVIAIATVAARAVLGAKTPETADVAANPHVDEGVAQKPAAPPKLAEPVAVTPRNSETPIAPQVLRPRSEANPAPRADGPIWAPLSPLSVTEERPAAFKRRRPVSTPDDLARELLEVKELTLEKSFNGPVHQALVDHAREHQHELAPPPAPALARLAGGGLPLRMGLDCRLGKESAEALQVYSRKLHDELSGGRKTAETAQDPPGPAIRARIMSRTDYWREAAAVPTLVQVLQAEDTPLRMALVELLANVKGPEAGKALARRAIFDTSAEVRELAVTALRGRPAAEYQLVLIDGLRHLWPTAAEFAAEALVNVGEKSAIPKLIRLLDEPDPAGPVVRRVGEDEECYVRELVRVNHVRNCMLCHPPSLNEVDPVRAVVADPRSRSSSGYSGSGSLFVRADSTYLRQDFSMQQPVAGAERTAAFQRFDYVTRSRTLAPNDAWVRPTKKRTYAQRDSTLYALRELSGRDYGETLADWHAYLVSEFPTN